MAADEALGKQFKKRRPFGPIYTTWQGVGGVYRGEEDADADEGDAGYGDMGEAGDAGGGEGAF